MFLLVYRASIFPLFFKCSCNCNESHRTFVYSTHNYRIKFCICPIFILLQLNCDGVSEKEFVTENNATLLYLRNNLILKKSISRN